MSSVVSYFQVGGRSILNDAETDKLKVGRVIHTAVFSYSTYIRTTSKDISVIFFRDVVGHWGCRLRKTMFINTATYNVAQNPPLFRSWCPPDVSSLSGGVII